MQATQHCFCALPYVNKRVIFSTMAVINNRLTKSVNSRAHRQRKIR